jgi:hypothetical protein
MRGRLVLAAAAAIMLAAPAAAELQIINFTGTAVVGTGNLNDPVLSSLGLTAVSGTFFVDTALASASFTGPLSGHGGGVVLTGAVQGSSIGFAGGLTLTGIGGAPANIFIVNDGGVPGAGNENRRIDQAIYTTTASPGGGSPLLPFLALGPLPSDVFVSQLRLGRTAFGELPTPPDLVTDLNNPDFFQYLSAPGGTPAFLSITFRQGNPLTGIPTLPQRTINIVDLAFSLGGVDAAVPEPSSWAMLIAGFGLVGAAARRRRQAVA